MKLTLVFLCAFVAISHQQFQQRPRGVIWLAPYYSRPQPANGLQQALYYSYDAPYYNQDFTKDSIESQENLDENEYYSKIRGSFGQQQQQNARFFFASNPFITRMSAPTVMSMVTTTSIQYCVPQAELKNGAKAVSCRRKKRESLSYDDHQFPINPTETQKLIPTALPSSLDREIRQLPDLTIDPLFSSKDKLALGQTSNVEKINLRQKRLFFNNNAMASTVTSFIFVPKVVTQTVHLIDGTKVATCNGGTDVACALCLPAGYVVCP